MIGEGQMILKVIDHHGNEIKTYNTADGYTEEFIQQMRGYCDAQGFKYELL